MAVPRTLPIRSSMCDDTLWVPRVASLGWLALTRDLSIRENPRERQSVRDSGARMVGLSGADAGNKWSQLQLLKIRWDAIEALLDDPGPFIYLARRSGPKIVPLNLNN